MNKLRMLELARCGIISEMEKEEFKVEKQKLYLKKIKQGSYKGGKSFCKIIEDINFVSQLFKIYNKNYLMLMIVFVSLI